MPQLPALDGFPYIGQDEDSLACVPACVEMVCEFLGISKDRDVIEEELDYSIDTGTPFRNVGLLSGVQVIQIRTVDQAADELERGLPVIANLRIDDADVLGYAAQRPFDHAVVMVGVQSGSVVFFDPESLNQLSTCGPNTCDRTAFEQAWLSGWLLVSLPGDWSK